MFLQISEGVLGSGSQYAERILNKIAKTFNKTYIGLKKMLQRFEKKNSEILGVREWNPPGRFYSQSESDVEPL